MKTLKGCCKVLLGKRLFPLATVCCLAGLAAESNALTITAGPTLTTFDTAPLSCLVELSTSEPARLFVEVSDGTEGWRRDFFRYDTTLSIPLHGFKADRSYTIHVSVESLSGDVVSSADALSFDTGPLPESFPPFEVITADQSRMEPGFTLCGMAPRNPPGPFLGHTLALDSQGEVVWYRPGTFAAVRQLKNGNLLLQGSTIYETDFLGRPVAEWNSSSFFHHDAFPTKHGTILSLINAQEIVPGYPSSATDPNAPPHDASVLYDIVVELSRSTGQLLNQWSLLEMLDPYRIAYDSVSSSATGVNDWTHSNAVIEDPTDGNILVSMRHQDAVIKFSRTTGQLIWILGNHSNWNPTFQPYLLEPVGSPFEWQYHQHAMKFTRSGSLILFDNGNYRASPFDPALPNNATYSRAVEFAIDAATMSVRQVWEFGGAIPTRLFSASISDADELPQTGNALITFGNLTHEGGVSVTPQALILEITRGGPPQAVLEVRVRDNRPVSPVTLTTYRSERIFDLYARGDLDLDGDVDRADLDVVLRARNRSALSPLDPRDLDRDGRITALDARALAASFYGGGRTE